MELLFNDIAQILIFVVIFGIGFALGVGVTTNHYRNNKPHKQDENVLH